MFKKLLLCVLIGGFFNLIWPAPETWAQDHTKFIRGHGGLIATGEQIENGKVYGTFRIDGLFKTYKWIYGIVGFQDILTGKAVDGENYDAGVCYFTRDPNSPKPQLYLIVGNGITHISGNGKSGEYTYGGGFGVLIPWSALGVTLMGQIKVTQIVSDRLIHLSFGIQSGLDL